MSDALGGLTAAERDALRDRPVSDVPCRPMLATLTHEPFSDPDWIFERKLDGVRCLVFRDGGEPRLRSRSGRDMGSAYPEIVEALEGQRTRAFVADGEIVAFDGKRTSFAKLQPRMQLEDPERARRTGVTVYLYLFDLLNLEGRDLTRLPLRSRKSVLKRALDFDTRVRLGVHRNEMGEEYLKEACRKGWEGLIAKRADSTYVTKRSRDWLKLKCEGRQEMVIGGWTDPEGSRTGFGALLLGYHEKGRLRYAGKVGTGFDEKLLESLTRRLEKLERDTSPFDDEVREKRVHWARPRLVGEVAFTEWTREGRLRHPRFVGLRTDKKAKDVVREG